MAYTKITNFAIKDSTNDIIKGTEFDDEFNSIEASFTAQPSATQTLTNKTVALGSNTVSGTFAQFNTAVTDAELARTDAANTFTGTQTFGDVTTTGNTILGNASTDTLNVGNGDLIKDASGNTLVGSGGTASSKFNVIHTNNNTNSSTYFWANSPSQTIQNLSNTANSIASLGFYLGSAGNAISAVGGIQESTTLGALGFFTGGSGVGGTVPERMRIDSSGNVGVGVTPNAWGLMKPLQIAGGAALAGLDNNTYLGANWYFDGANSKYIATDFATLYTQSDGTHKWETAASGTAGNPITFTQAMTLDASGNLLVGQASGSYNIISKVRGSDNGEIVLSVERQQTGVSALLCYSVSQTNYNAANAANKMGRDATTFRSLNAGGTINASGADYAEYMTKASDFILAKGDVVGIDANGKLTNVFADAISFVVKSTDPSYVGGDSWGSGLEDNSEELEAARQLVDRIAFAGQVPVNVLGATAGQYIIPVNDNGAIKGEAISSPTFEQYQTAVGKVIAIEADGSAKIIVKVA